MKDIQANIEAAFPLTPVQEGILFHCLQEDGCGLYNLQISWELEGNVDLGALKRAWDQVHARYSALRTSYAWKKTERFLQVVHKRAVPPFKELDFSALEAGEAAEAARRAQEDDLKKDFDLSAAPLSRFILIRFSASRYHLVWTQHHLNSDGWSMGIMIDAFWEAYRGLRLDFGFELSPEKHPFRDYAAWLQGKSLPQAIAHWQGHLKGVGDARKLPWDALASDSSPAKAWEMGILPFEFSPDETAKFKRAAARSGVTLNVFFLGAWGHCLSKLCGTDETVLGMAAAGRDDTMPWAQEMVGNLIHTLPVRIAALGAAEPGAWLKAVQSRLLDHLENQQASLVSIRPPEVRELFRYLYVYYNLPSVAAVPEAELGFSMRLQSSIEMSNYPLCLSVIPGDRLALKMEYRTDAFSHGGVSEILTSFRRRVSDLANRVLGEALPKDGSDLAWVETEEDPDLDGQTFFSLFEVSVKRRPSQEAVSGNGAALDYGGLDRLSSALAETLRAEGLAEGRRVGLLMERSVDALVCILGLWKAGLSYVPLDPALPRARIVAMAEAAELALVIFDRPDHQHLVPEELAHGLYDQGSLRVIGELRPGTPVEGSDTAYVMFTSGSTGVPKGVEVRHRALLNCLLAVGKSLRMGDTDKVAAVTSLSFDISTVELLMPLLFGASIRVFSGAEVLEANRLARAIREEKVSVAQATPALWHVLVEEGAEHLLGLRKISGGEALGRQLASHLLKLGGELWNFYGPTETTVWSSFQKVEDPSSITLGRPLSGTQMAVVDPDGKLKAQHDVGELLIGGSGLAKGYVGDPEKTAAKFIQWPDSDGRHRRMYRTGDLVRMRSDGQVEYLGRTDHQVKIRGHRIELGEIEAVLEKAPGVSAVVAQCVAGADKELSLTAFYLSDGSLGVGELRSWASRNLPAFMLPSEFVALKEIPTTPNGKTDRLTLQKMARRPPQDEERASEMSALEELLAGLWSEVLGKGRLGPESNFFAQGGHSILAIKLASKVRRVFGMPFSVKEVLSFTSLRAMAAHLSKKIGSRGEEPSSTVLQKQGRAGETGRFFEFYPDGLEGRFGPYQGKALDAAAIWYPDLEMLISEDDWEDVVDVHMQKGPQLSAVLETSLGRIGMIMMPLLDFELYSDPKRTKACIENARDLAGSLGAQVVTLTGLLPSASAYGEMLEPDLAGRPEVTTGLNTTAATVVLNLLGTLGELKRSCERERLGIIGLGAVGVGVLETLAALRHLPSDIVLCDVESRRSYLEDLSLRIRSQFGYKGRLSIAISGSLSNDEIYACSVLVGATNSAGALDVERLRPGVVCIDDSAPHCFDLEKAMQRMEGEGDILIVEGGLLRSSLDQKLTVGGLHGFHDFKDRPEFRKCITGCVLSGLLSARFPKLASRRGYPRSEDSTLHFEAMTDLGYRANHPVLGDVIHPRERIEAFAHRYGEADVQ